VPGAAADLNQSLERAGRVADYLELAELIVADALAREESCGCHLREEYQTEEGEARGMTTISPMWRSGNTGRARPRPGTGNNSPSSRSN
jgi:succinate dehydrogenase/fumarate reductase flavoprotein subunit